MKQVVTAFVAMICFAIWERPGDAQQPQPKQVQVTFINLTGIDVSVQGSTVVAGVQRRGAILQMKKKGGQAFEQMIPASTVRHYTISDPLQPARTFLVNFPVNVPGRDVVLKIMPSPTNPKTLVIVAD